jgi:hypothetical protein
MTNNWDIRLEVKYMFPQHKAKCLYKYLTITSEFRQAEYKENATKRII